MPTAARNSVSPKLRSVRFAASGQVPGQGAAPAEVSQDERDDERAARKTQRERAHARDRDLDETEQDAERHAQADRDVGELRRRLQRVAEVLPHGGNRLAGRDERRRGRRTRARDPAPAAARRRRGAPRRSWRRRRRESGIRRAPCRPRRPSTRTPARRRARRGPGEAAGIDASEREPGLVERVRRAEQQDAVAGREAACGSGSLLVSPCRMATRSTPAGRRAISSATVTSVRRRA